MWIKKELPGKKPRTMMRLADDGRKAFEGYRENMKQALEELPKL